MNELVRLAAQLWGLSSIMKNPKLEARFIELQAARLELAVAVESGTLRGETTRSLAATRPFEVVYSIEASRELWRLAAHGFGAAPDDFDRIAVADVGGCRVELIHGDSADVLPKLCSIIQRPAFFYLDAHYCRDDPRAVRTEDHPLFAELAAIAARPFADLVWVDDVHTFGQDRDDLGQSWRAITKETIKERLGFRAGVSCQVGDGFAIEMMGMQ